LEGFVSFIIDLIVYHLVSEQHHDISYRGRFADSLNEVSSISLYNKLEFLERHGYDFFDKICDGDLRIAIAHHRFEIGTQGKVIYSGREILPKELAHKINDMSRLSDLFLKLIE
jgi:hypothetical protein